MYDKQNCDKLNTRKRIHLINRYETDIIFCLFCKTRSRIRQALQGKRKSSSTKDIVGIGIETYRKWTKIHFTTEMTWDNIELDHVKPICKFNISNDEKLGDAFSWKILSLTQAWSSPQGNKIQFPRLSTAIH